MLKSRGIIFLSFRVARNKRFFDDGLVLEWSVVKVLGVGDDEIHLE